MSLGCRFPLTPAGIAVRALRRVRRGTRLQCGHWVVGGATMGSAVVDASVAGQDESFPLRITAVLERRDDRWVIQHAHFSAPTFTQEPGQSFPARAGAVDPNRPASPAGRRRPARPVVSFA